MIKRLKLECWQCEREYSQTKEITNQTKLFVECPFCFENGVMDLAPYLEESQSVLKDLDGDDIALETLNLPPVLPTAPRTDAESADDLVD